MSACPIRPINTACSHTPRFINTITPIRDRPITGPGDFAPHPTYQEGALPYYGGYYPHRYHAWHAHTGYWGHPGMRYGYEHHGYGYHGYEHHGYSMRYGYHGMPHQYGYRQHTRRYY